MNDEQYYAMALTRLTGISQPMALQLYRELGSARAVYEHRSDLSDVIPAAASRLQKALPHWDEALRRAEAEMEFASQHYISILTPADAGYPVRMAHCADAPMVLYYRGTASLNQRHIVAIVGTRHATPYGQDLIRRFVADLRQQCPDALIVSGLAYGIDICAHRCSLEQGYDTVGVLAHGLDQIYPPAHRETATAMLAQGGLLTEYMSQTEPYANNFRQRNRIVAGLADATILVESAYKGGGLITCRVAQEYGRDVFAFPGAVGAPYSEGCNRMIRSNTAGLITSAADFLEAIGWETVKDMPLWAAQPAPAAASVPLASLTAEEQQVVGLLRQTNDLQLNVISVKTNIPIGQLTALLFSLEMKGVVRPLAGGTYHFHQV